MIYRLLGRPGILVSAISLGCEGFMNKSGNEVRADLDFAEANGINFFDLYASKPDRVMDFICNNQIVPAVNQIELHPFCQQTDAAQFLADNGVQTQSWAPFAEGRNGLFDNEVLVSIATRHGRSVSQIVLRWMIERNIAVIPKSVRKERIAENIDVFDFELSADDKALIATLDKGESAFLDHRDPEMVKWICNLH